MALINAITGAIGNKAAEQNVPLQQDAQAAVPVVPNNGNPNGAYNMPKGRGSLYARITTARNQGNPVATPIAGNQQTVQLLQTLKQQGYIK